MPLVSEISNGLSGRLLEIVDQQNPLLAPQVLMGSLMVPPVVAHLLLLVLLPVRAAVQSVLETVALAFGVTLGHQVALVDWRKGSNPGC